MKSKDRKKKQHPRTNWRPLLLILGLCLITLISTQAAAANDTASLTISPDFVYLPENGSQAVLVANLTNDFPKDAVIVWSVDNPSLLDLTPNGDKLSVEAKVDVGTAVITATYQDLSATAKVIIGYGIETDVLSILLTDINQSYPIHFKVHDMWIKAPIEWNVQDPSVLTLTENNGFVQIVSNVPVGSTIVTATYRDITYEIPVVIATLQEDTLAISPDYFQQVHMSTAGSSITELTAVLEQNIITEGIEPGSIIINSESTEALDHIALKVTHVSSNGATITAQGVPATLEETYRYLDIDLVHSQIAYIPELSGDTYASKTAVTSLCTTNTSTATIEMTAFDISMPATPIQSISRIKIGDNGLESLLIGADIDLDFTVQGPTFDIAASSAFSFECDIAIPGLANLISVPIPNSFLALNLSPTVGIEGTAAVQVAQASLTLGDLNFQYTARYGVLYDGTTWSKINESTTPDFDAELISFDNNWDIEFQLSLYPRFKADVGIGIVGVPLVNIEFLTAKAGIMNSVTVPAAAIINSPRPPNSDYINPEWQSSKLATATLAAGVGGPLGSVIEEYIADNIPQMNLEHVILNYEHVIGETADITLAPTDIIVPPGTPTDLTVSVRPFGSGSMVQRVYENNQVNIWASKDGAQATLLGGGFIDELGNLTISWTPSEMGTYEIAALVFDRITGTFFMPFMTESSLVTVSDSGSCGMLLNCSFEEQPTFVHWTPVADNPGEADLRLSNDAHSGSYSAEFVFYVPFPSSASLTSAAINVNGASCYNINLYKKSIFPTTSFDFGVLVNAVWYDSAQQYIRQDEIARIGSNAPNWEEASSMATAPFNAATLQIELWGGGVHLTSKGKGMTALGSVFIDDIHIEETPCQMLAP